MNNNYLTYLLGANSSPSDLNISSLVGTPTTLTWLPPPNGPNCSFNYTVNITSSSSSMTEQVYNSTSLTLTNLTRGENYSFVVAVTDSTGQHGAWSESLIVAWNGEWLKLCQSSIVSFKIFLPL